MPAVTTAILLVALLALSGCILPALQGTAAVVLLPVIEALVGMVIAPKAAAMAMPVDTAREILAAAAQGR